MRNRVQHYSTNIPGNIPSSSDFLKREIGINYAAGTESLFIKNSNDEIVRFLPPQDSLIMVTSGVSDSESNITPPPLKGLLL